ncbi:uncharacterized protein LOC117186793 isoform X1 [Drosophila miranda]|uniref:uncharacterized protein LOC117186793 isoform X1 n=2 Tax=Drosophila miranda TaxID=7229 RepID=UPI00143F5E2F|nr:uncharacterized protein LOC117186793 isoform X1 [Drosophila miranda]
MTPLHWAVEKKHKTIVRMLLKCQADVSLVSKFGKTPIALAVYTEQADVLAELEAARQAQASRKFNEETEFLRLLINLSIYDFSLPTNAINRFQRQTHKSRKETSEAVNSIMNEPGDTKRNDDTEMSVEERMDVLENLRGHTNVLGNSALNMLKTHGIADMMQENDDYASKEMLNTALQNGRQLVLSEGGRMLLHETKSSINIKQYVNGSASKSPNAGLRLTPNNSPPQKIRMNVIKQKEPASSNPHGVSKNKNIRIISLTDFKKLGGTDNQPKSLQKIPALLASSGMVRQLPDGTKVVNMRQLQSRQLKLPSVQRTLEPSMLDEQQHLLKDVISPSSQQAPAANPATASTLRGQVGTVQTIQLRPSPAAGAALGTTSNGVASKAVGNVAKLGAKGANVMPLLTSSEICRELHELRRQNEESRRRVDSFHREKEQMVKRIDRLEHLVLIREAEIDYLGDL